MESSSPATEHTMKTNLTTLRGLVLVSAFTTPAYGGDLALDPTPLTPVAGEPDAFAWLTPNVDITARYEFRNQEDLDAANALTARARVGLLLGDFGGFSAFGELETTVVAVNDFQTTDSTFPTRPGKTAIDDPRNFELNRAWVEYKKEGFYTKVGRQRIIRNEAAFIGNVGWRQNEQTFDAALVGYQDDALAISYVYSNQANRIFGAQSNDGPPGPPLREFEGDFHFIDADYKTDFGNVGGYAYLIDVENNANVGESNTFGAFTNIDKLYAEFAFQEGESAFSGDYEALYAHVNYTIPVGKAKLKGGIEYLSDDFKTPFSTAHAFNGFADAFVLDRIGLRNGPDAANGSTFDGITDIYLGYIRPGLPGGVVGKAFVHYFADDSLDQTYGYEADLVLVKKFSDSVTAVLKAAYFLADDNSGYSDIAQVSVQLDYSF